MKGVIRIEVRFDDGREGGSRREAKQAEIAAKAAAKAAIHAILISSGIKVTETSSVSFPTSLGRTAGRKTPTSAKRLERPARVPAAGLLAQSACERPVADRSAA